MTVSKCPFLRKRERENKSTINSNTRLLLSYHITTQHNTIQFISICRSMASTSRMNEITKKASFDTAAIDICRRQAGQLSTRIFAHHFANSEDLVMKLDLERNLQKHTGCVNSVSYNALGDILVSASDDRKVMLWDWKSGSTKLSFISGHKSNILQAKIVPGGDERSIITCAADGHVRHASISECGNVKTKLLGKHQGRAHELANDPANPHVFYTCGEDGIIQHFDLRTGDASELLKCEAVRGRIFTSVVHLTTIAIDPLNPNSFVVAGSDEFTRLYDLRRYRYDSSTPFGKPVDHFCPEHLLGDENVGITGVSFSDQGELLVSYSEEFIYLFSKNMGRGSDINSILDHQRLIIGSDSEMEIDSNPGPQSFKGHRNCLTVKGVSFFGGNEYVASGSDCGRMFIWKKKDARLVRVIEADTQVVNCIQPHPHTLMLASCGMDRDIKIWRPTALEKAPAPTNINTLRYSTYFWRVPPRDTALELIAMRNQGFPRRSFAEGESMDLIVTLDEDSDDDEFWW